MENHNQIVYDILEDAELNFECFCSNLNEMAILIPIESNFDSIFILTMLNNIGLYKNLQKLKERASKSIRREIISQVSQNSIVKRIHAITDYKFHDITFHGPPYSVQLIFRRV